MVDAAIEIVKQFKKQIDVVENLAEQISGGNNSLRGLMLESHLLKEIKALQITLYKAKVIPMHA